VSGKKRNDAFLPLTTLQKIAREWANEKVLEGFFPIWVLTR